MVQKIYSHKLKTKSYAPWLYGGENEKNYFNYRMFQTSFKDKVAQQIIEQKQVESTDLTKRRLILGLECSFNDSCASVVSSTGQILSNAKKTFPKSRQPDSLMAAKSFHTEQMPLMIEKALADA
jgi:tRNA A37 threonylcarbamoyltransferase TsaD